MLRLIRELECLNCSNKRFFVQHTVSGEHVLTQEMAAALPRSAVLTCGHCGSKSLVAGVGDGFPYRAPGTVQSRYRRPRGAAAAAVGSTLGSHGDGGLATTAR